MRIVTLEETTDLIRANRFIVVSNRGPGEYFLDENKTLNCQRSPGGLVTVLSSVASFLEATWVSVAMTEGDRLAMQKAQGETGDVIQFPLHDQKMQLRYITLPEEVFHKYYEEISAQFLWFTYNYMYDLVAKQFADYRILDAWMNGYCVANQAVAEGVCIEIARGGRPPIVLLQDNLLCLVSSIIRNAYPSVVIQQFLHWPWPDLRYLSFLPSDMIQAIYEGLMGNDIIGFQTERDARNFLDGAHTMLGDADVDVEHKTVSWHGRRILVRTYPISIAVEEVYDAAYSVAGKDEEEEIQPFLDKKTIMRVDRMDPIKNIVTGFRAYEYMLDEHPELLEKVVFLAFLTSTREGAPLYMQYKDEIIETIEEINQKYRSSSWMPIHAFFGNNRTRSLVAMRFYDALLVNSLADGMNLVAKEGVVVNQRDGVLVLSRTTGVYTQLGKSSIPISPTSVVDTARALFKALTLSPEERCAYAREARQTIEHYDLNDWLSRQLSDIYSILQK